ncbi:MAG: PLP-dependent aminotransferase family protein [Desulfurococcaceae archaeon]
MVDYSRYYSTLALSMKPSAVRALAAIMRKLKDVITFTGGYPDPATFPKEEIGEIAKEVITKYGTVALQYGETKGVFDAREAICSFVNKTKGIKCDPNSEIILTTGSQESLYLVGKIFANPGDYVITENPTYISAIGAFKVSGVRFIGIPFDEYGMKTDLLEQKLSSLPKEELSKVKYIYTIPVAQNPGGVSMSLERKKHLLEIASKYDLIIFEDDPYSYIVFEKDVDITPLKAMDKEGRIVYTSTISKILSPGLRVGWIVGDQDVISKAELVKSFVNLHTSNVDQLITAEAIKQGIVERNLAKALPLYKAKKEAMLNAIKENFPEYVWHSNPIGGLFVFLYVNKPGFDADALLPKSVEQYRVAYIPGSGFHVDNSGKNSMRLNFSYPTFEQIKEGIARLGKLIKEA